VQFIKRSTALFDSRENVVRGGGYAGIGTALRRPATWQD
jgi:hypothetical protein